MKTFIRKFHNGNLIALFPEIKDSRGFVASYSGGYFGASDFQGVWSQTWPLNIYCDESKKFVAELEKEFGDIALT